MGWGGVWERGNGRTKGMVTEFGSLGVVAGVCCKGCGLMGLEG